MRRLLVCASLFACLCAPARAAEFHDGSGLHVVSVKQVTPRVAAVTLTTKALPAQAQVYVLLPPDYDAHPKKRWPVFYLLDGTSGRASDWTTAGHAEKVIGDRPVITVMPDITLDGNGGGWCSDWPGGGQAWETFHIQQLVPWIDRNLRTKTSRGGRAIAGLSQGGFCSLSYAARHPDLFGTALGYSGAPDIYYDPVDRVGAMAIINGTEMGLSHQPPDTFFGDPVSNGINWAAHDPATLAENLRWTRMYMYWGNGFPGPFDPDPVSGLSGGSEVEAAVNQSNLDFQKRLNALAIPAYFDDYGNGTHRFEYWQRDLEWSIDKIMRDFAHPAVNPSQFTYTSAEDEYSVYGWDVEMHRAAREFSTLAGASCRGFSLSGSGAGVVATPSCYRPGARYEITMTGTGVDSTTYALAPTTRRLGLTVPLGPAGSTSTTNVTITRVRG